MRTPRRGLAVFATMIAAAAATAAAAAILLGDAGASAARAAPAPALPARAAPAEPGLITIEGAWRAIAPGEAQTVDEVRCPDSHPFVFNERYGSGPWQLTPGVEVRVEGGRADDLVVDIRSVLTRLADATVIGLGPAERNRVRLDGSGAVATYRVDVHCTSDEQDSYA